MNMLVKKSKSNKEIKDDFSFEENDSTDIFTFTEGEPQLEGTLLRSFSFDSDDELIEANLNSPTSDNMNPKNISSPTTIPLVNTDNNTEILDHRTSKANPNGRTPSVDGEAFDMVRSYTLRRSTVRILSKIKAIHVDDNVYLNTIVDEAIRYYYDYLKNQDKKVL